MRVAVIADRAPPAWGGGVASAHYHLGRLLAAHGCTVKTFTYFDEAEADGADVVRRTTPKRLVRLIRRANNLLFRLAEPGTAAYQTQDIAVRAWGALRLNRPLADFAPDVAVFPDHGAPSLWLRTPPGCRRVMVAHHNPSRFLDLAEVERFSARDVRLAMAIEDRALCRIDRVVCPSHYMEGVFRATHRFAGEVVVAPNVVDPAFLDGVAADDPRPALGLAEGDPLVYLPAGGNRFKGADLTPEIIARLSAASDRPVGFFLSGSVPAQLRQRLPAGARIHAPGAQSAPSVLATVKACSFGIYPTLVENYSMALLEAALAGVPMVTTAVGGNGEIVAHGVNGFLSADISAAALCGLALPLLDPAAAAAMRAATLADAAQRLSAAGVGARVVAAVTGAGR